MKTLQEALHLILQSAHPLTATEQIPLLSAMGRFLAEPIRSQINVPPADNSAMDGYALYIDAPTGGEKRYAISQVINAGHVGTPLLADTVARIFTGAEIPAGANSVAMQENCLLSDTGDTVQINATLPGDNIRRRGQDIAEGDQLFAAGHRLTPIDIGLVASVGIAQVPVFRKPKIAILATGDELVEPGGVLGPGQIYNSNRYLLQSALIALGCEVHDLGMVADTLQATENTLLKGLDADLIISTGGVSVGEADFVKTAVANLGVLESWKIAIKPGKPLAFGRIKNTPFLGLPGNPVAVFVTFLLVVKPFIQTLCNNFKPHATRLFPLAFATSKASERTDYVRIKINSEGKVERFANQSSGVLSSVAWADGLAILPAGQTFAIDEKVDVILLNDHLFS